MINSFLTVIVLFNPLSLFKINSPIRLSSEPSLAVNNTLPYLSLQPPPGRQLGDAVQFEDFDLYMWPSAQYQTPNLLFYAGPVRFPDQQNRTQPETQEVYTYIMYQCIYMYVYVSACVRMSCG